MNTRRSIITNDNGQTMAEYAIILAFIFLVVVVVLPSLGIALNGIFQSVVQGL